MKHKGPHRNRPEEIDDAGFGVGYTGGYMRVRVKDGKPGEVVRVQILSADDEELTGEIIENESVRRVYLGEHFRM